MPTSTKYSLTGSAIGYRSTSSSADTNSKLLGLVSNCNSLDDDVNRLESVLGISPDLTLAGLNYATNNTLVDGESLIESLERFDTAVGGPVFAVTTANATGTITTTAGANTVTGVGTNFQAGDVGKYIFTASGQIRKIATRSSTTAVTVDQNWSTTESGVNFLIPQVITSAKIANNGIVIPSTTIQYEYSAVNKAYADFVGAVKGVQYKNSAYDVVNTDKGQVFITTTGSPTHTINTSFISTAGSYCWFKNTGSGTVTIDPAGAVTIDGAATLTLSQNHDVCLFTDGSNLFSVGKRANVVVQSLIQGVTITSASVATAAHNLSTTPVLMQNWLRCTSANNNWSSGDKTTANPGGYTRATAVVQGMTVACDATNNYYYFSSDSPVFYGFDKSTRASVSLTNSSWVVDTYCFGVV